MEGNLRFKTDWASLIVGSEFTVFALFYFVFEGNFPSISPRGAYIWRDYLTEGFLRYRFGGLTFGGACTWRGLFSEFYGISVKSVLFLLSRVSLSARCLTFQRHFFKLIFEIMDYVEAVAIDKTSTSLKRPKFKPIFSKGLFR